MEGLYIEQQARLLFQGLVDGIEESTTLSTVTTAIYDTAWLSMVSKKEEEMIHWLFPECFQFLLSGEWESYAIKEDGILNTLAALLALKRHRYSADDCAMLEDDIQRATRFLENSLQTLDMNKCLPVGFEILVPPFLAMLENESVQFSFPARDSLHKLNEKKLKFLTPDILYGTAETTLLHSLEAFNDKIDFNRVDQRKSFGSMMTSPTSTAAYLMNVSWDEEAESYLRRVINEGPGEANGAIFSVFPTLIFEIS